MSPAIFLLTFLHSVVKVQPAVRWDRFRAADPKQPSVSPNRWLTPAPAGDDKHSSLGGQNQTGKRRHEYTHTSKQKLPSSYTHTPAHIHTVHTGRWLITWHSKPSRMHFIVYLGCLLTVIISSLEQVKTHSGEDYEMFPLCVHVSVRCLMFTPALSHILRTHLPYYIKSVV